MIEHVHCLPLEGLSADHWSAWERIRAVTPSLAGPFFDSRFAREVDRVRGDVEVAVVERDDEPIAFLPFQRERRGTGRPVGGRLSDFHGLIAAPETTVDPRHLLARCRLHRWVFDHLVEGPSHFEPHVWRVDESPAIDVSNGFEAYVEERRRSGSQRIKRVGKKRRKLARERGRVEVELECRDPDVLRVLFEWKSAQYRRSRLPDLFARRWITDLLANLLREPSEACSGWMAVLRVEGKPVAVDYGLRSGSVFHSWFPSYDPEFAPYGPGNVLLVGTVEGAEALGISRIELGKGPEPYKRSFCNASTLVGTGAVDRNPVRRWFSKTIDVSRRRLAKSWLRPALNPTLPLARRITAAW